MDIGKYKSVRFWHQNIPNRGTRSHWTTYLRKFCDFTGKTPDQLIEERKIQLESADVVVRRHAEVALKRFVEHLKEKYAPTSRKNAWTSVKSFYEAHELDLKFKKRETPRGKALKHHTAPENETIRKLLEVLSIRDKAVILLQKDSGLSISDILGLRVGDLKDMGQGFVMIQKHRRKTDEPFVTFAGSESTKIINLYLDLRRKGTQRKYHIRKLGRCKEVGIPPEKITPESPLFRSKTKRVKVLDYATFHKIIRNACLGLGISDFTPHGLRVRFQTTLESCGVNRNWIKRYMGHSLSEIEAAYSQPKHLFEAYKKAYPKLCVHQEIDSDEIKKLQDKVEELEMYHHIFEGLKAQSKLVGNIGPVSQLMQQMVLKNRRGEESSVLPVSTGINRNCLQKIVTKTEAKELINSGTWKYVNAWSEKEVVLERL